MSMVMMYTAVRLSIAQLDGLNSLNTSFILNIVEAVIILNNCYDRTNVLLYIDLLAFFH